MNCKIKINIAEKQLYYKGEVIVKYVIKYPEIIISESEELKRKFNHLNRQKALIIKNFAEGPFYNEAKEMYDFNKLNGYPTMVYELIKDIEFKK